MIKNKKVTIIAECCQNHNGDLKILKDMIWAAASAGADYVKIQSMLASDLAYREVFEEGLIEEGETKAIKRPYRTEYDRLKPLDLDVEALFLTSNNHLSTLANGLPCAASSIDIAIPWRTIANSLRGSGFASFLAPRMLSLRLISG